MAGDDGFIAHFEVAVFAAVLFTLFGAVSETLGVLHAKNVLWRDTTQLARVAADSRDADLFLSPDEQAMFAVSVSDGPCPVVTVRAKREYEGVASRRLYVLRADVTVPVTLYRTFSPTERAGEPC